MRTDKRNWKSNLWTVTVRWITLDYVVTRVKPRPYQQQCRSNIVECYSSNDSFEKKTNVASTKSNVASTLLLLWTVWTGLYGRNARILARYGRNARVTAAVRTLLKAVTHRGRVWGRLRRQDWAGRSWSASAWRGWWRWRCMSTHCRRRRSTESSRRWPSWSPTPRGCVTASRGTTGCTRLRPVDRPSSWNSWPSSYSKSWRTASRQYSTVNHRRSFAAKRDYYYFILLLLYYLLLLIRYAVNLSFEDRWEQM